MFLGLNKWYTFLVPILLFYYTKTVENMIFKSTSEYRFAIDKHRRKLSYLYSIANEVMTIAKYEYTISIIYNSITDAKK